MTNDPKLFSDHKAWSEFYKDRCRRLGPVYCTVKSEADGDPKLSPWLDLLREREHMFPDTADHFGSYDFGKSINNHIPACTPASKPEDVCWEPEGHPNWGAISGCIIDGQHPEPKCKYDMTCGNDGQFTCADEPFGLKENQ